MQHYKRMNAMNPMWRHELPCVLTLMQYMYHISNMYIYIYTYMHTHIYNMYNDMCIIVWYYKQRGDSRKKGKNRNNVVLTVDIFVFCVLTFFAGLVYGIVLSTRVRGKFSTLVLKLMLYHVYWYSTCIHN